VLKQPPKNLSTRTKILEGAVLVLANSQVLPLLCSPLRIERKKKINRLCSPFMSSHRRYVSIPQGGGLAAGEGARDEVPSDPPLGPSHCGHAKVGRAERRRKSGGTERRGSRCWGPERKGVGFQLREFHTAPAATYSGTRRRAQGIRCRQGYPSRRDGGSCGLRLSGNNSADGTVADSGSLLVSYSLLRTHLPRTRA
jgi:hypothetical protein